jgi:hypothetical protein
VDGVDDDAAGVVDEQVERLGRARSDQPRRLGGVEREARARAPGRCRCRAAPARSGGRQLAARAQPGDRQVQAPSPPATTTRRSPHRSSARSSSSGVPVDTTSTAHLAARPRRLDGLLVGAAGVRAGEQQVPGGASDVR